MVSKLRGRYVMIDKTAMILKLEENLHTTEPNVGKPNFSLVEKLYPEFSRKMLRDWYSKKDKILKFNNKHKRFKLDNPKARSLWRISTNGRRIRKVHNVIKSSWCLCKF